MNPNHLSKSFENKLFISKHLKLCLINVNHIKSDTSFRPPKNLPEIAMRFLRLQRKIIRLQILKNDCRAILFPGIFPVYLSNYRSIKKRKIIHDFSVFPTG